MTNCTRFQYLDYVRTTYRKAFRADSKCASGILWTVTAQNWNKSFTNIKHRAGAVGREGLVNWIFPSISVGPSPLSYLFTSATARIPVHTAPKWGTELIRYVTLHVRHQQAQLRSVTVQKQRQKLVADPGVGPGAPPPLFLDQTEVQRAEKNFSGDWGPPPYLRVWMTASPPPLPYFRVWILYWKSPFFRVNRGPILYGFSAAANANRYSVNISLLNSLYTAFIQRLYCLFFFNF